MADGAEVLPSSKHAKYTGDIFESSTRFSCVIPLYVGMGRTVFTANDRSLANRTIVIKTRVCNEERLIEDVLNHAMSIRKLVHRNIATVFDAFVISDSSNCDGSMLLKRLCMVQENLDIDLHNLIRCGQVVTNHCRRFAYHLFSALRYAHSFGIGHFSLKPSNVLISIRDLTLKVADFGINQIVRKHQLENEEFSLTDITLCTSQWYHAPEVLLGGDELTISADMWSAGCVIAEMVLGRPLFAGVNETNQILKLVDALHLNDDDWTRVLRVMPNKLLKNHPFKPRNSLRSQLIPADRQAIHLLERLLTFNSSERISAEEALSDSYFSELRRATSGTVLADNRNTCFQNEASRGHDLSVSQSGLPNDTSGAAPNGSLRSSLHRQSSRDETDDIALHNFLNNHSCTGSPTSNADDRTPSPNIFDLLNHRLAERHEGSNKRASEASDSDGEKEVAEISDEKLREDLEIGNVSVELLRRLQCHAINEVIDLSSLYVSNPHGPTTVPGGICDTSDAQNQSVAVADNVKSSADENNDFRKLTQDFIDFVAGQEDFAEQLSGKSTTMVKIQKDESKSSSTVSGDGWNLHYKLSSPDDCNEDSNKRNTGFDFEEKNKKKQTEQTSLQNNESQAVAGVANISRKLIMDKIESEKMRARRRRSGAQSPGSRRFDVNLTSEEFDELYRLPTEHLRKEKQHAHALSERNSRSGIPDRHHRHHRHHSHDSFHGGREDRSYRDAEGACGGIDYYCYDDMAAITHSSAVDFDTETSPTSFLRHGEEFSVNTSLRHEDWVELSVAEVVPMSRGATLSAVSGRDATSSPESPMSPPTTQSGARPKKSPRKHRAL